MNATSFNYILLEDNIPYDWDDYDLWGAVLYDINKKEITTRKFGHGDDMKERAECIALKDAVEQNPEYITELIRVMVNALGTNPDNVIREMSTDYNINKPMCVPVNVTRGRKFKGDGYLVWGLWEYERYGLGAYHNSKNYYPIIFNPIDGTFNKVNAFGYLDFGEVFAGLKNAIINSLEHNLSSVVSLAHIWAYEMSYSSCDRTNKINAINRLTAQGVRYIFDNLKMPATVKKGIANEIKRQEKVEKEAAKEFIKQKKIDLYEWAKRKYPNDTKKFWESEVKRVLEKNYSSELTKSGIKL